MVSKVGDILPRYTTTEQTEAPNTAFHLYLYKPLHKGAVWIWEVTLIGVKAVTKAISALFSAIFSDKDAPLKPLVTLISNCVRPIYEKLGRVFLQVKESVQDVSSTLRTYAFFQAIETWVPGPLKAVANTCYTYSRDLFASLKEAWNDQTQEIKALVEERDALKTRYADALKQIARQIESIGQLITVGNLDQAIIQKLVAEKATLEEQLRLSTERNLLLNENGDTKEAQIHLLGERISLLKEELQILAGKSPASPLTDQETRELESYLSKGGHGAIYEIFKGVGICA